MSDTTESVWHVIANGAVTGAEYVYRVTGPADATPMEVTCTAYGMHGRKFRDGEVPEPLGPGAFTEPTT